MPIIKSDSAPASLRPFNMADVEAYARQMLQRATEKAEKLLAAAQAEADAMRKEAQSEGKALGLAEGKREGLAQGKAEGIATGKKQAYDEEIAKLQEQWAALSTLVQTVDAAHQASVGRAEEEILPLALAIAEKVTRRAGRFDASVCEANLREAVRLATTKHELRIFVHSSQLYHAHEAVERLKEQWPTMKHVMLTADDTLAPGGCRVLTGGGEIDADLDRQLERIAADLVPEPTEPASDKNLAA